VTLNPLRALLTNLFEKIAKQLQGPFCFHITWNSVIMYHTSVKIFQTATDGYSEQN